MTAHGSSVLEDVSPAPRGFLPPETSRAHQTLQQGDEGERSDLSESSKLKRERPQECRKAS